MKKSFVKIRLMISIIILAGLYPANLFSQDDYKNFWRQVEAIEKQGKPRSAIEVVNEIYNQAKKEKNEPQMLKALEYSIRLSMKYEEDYLQKGIARIDTEMSHLTSPSTNVLHSLKATLYLSYYQANRYKILDRTNIMDETSGDMNTWGQRQFASVIFGEFQKSLEHADKLQSVSAHHYSEILTIHDSLDVFRPTLYDILAHYALNFYLNDEFMASLPAIQFEIDDLQMLDIAESFVRLKIDEVEEFSMQFHALKLYQELITFHLADDDPGALTVLDLDRLEFVYHNAVFEDKSSTYKHTLEQMETQLIGNEAVTLVYHKIAEYYVTSASKFEPLVSDEHQRDLIIAAQYCRNAINEYPDSYGAALSRGTLIRINRKSLSSTLEYANLPGKEILSSISYKNVSKLYIRIVPLDAHEERIFNRNNRKEAIIDRYRKIRPVKQWTVELPAEIDHNKHRTEIALPALTEGFYGLMIADEPSFKNNESVKCFNHFWVTGISYIYNKNDNNNRDYYILDRKNGQAISGVDVQAFAEIYNQSSRKYEYVKSATYTSNKEGRFLIVADDAGHKRMILHFSKGNDSFSTSGPFYIAKPYKSSKKEKNKSYFFTDRSIYRPGQIIYFKGILLKEIDGEYEIRKNEKTLVQFFDANYQKISELELLSNEYGSVNASFIAPQGGLTGYMRIKNESGNVNFRVEEYKRPKFEVGLDPVEGSFRLNESITVTGSAMAYSGNPIDHASVKYRVTRHAYFPFRYHMWYYPDTRTAEIASGKVETDHNGAFEFDFIAIPDKSLHNRFKPVFTYTVYVDVTDISGETRSGWKSISVSEKSLLIELDIPEMISNEPDQSFKLTTTNLNGQPEPVDLDIKIIELADPGMILKKREWGQPDVYLIEKEDFKNMFPDFPYKDENDKSTWKTINTAYHKTIRTGDNTSLEIVGLEGWQPGEYKIEMTAEDHFGEEVKLTKYFTLFSNSGKMPSAKANIFRQLQTEGAPGEKVTFMVGTGHKNVQVLYEIQNKNGIQKHEWIKLSNELKVIEIPLSEEDRGGVSINLDFVYNNESYSNMAEFQVPYTNKELDISFETFRDKLLPGQKEEWKIRIRSNKGEKVAAELLAGMYDASLDDIFHHSWHLYLQRPHHHPNYWDFTHSFVAISSWISAPREEYTPPKPRVYNTLRWNAEYTYWGAYPLHKRSTLDGAVFSMAENDESRSAGLEDEMIPEEEVEANIKRDPPGNIPPPPPPGSDETRDVVPVRKNLQETAFFFPELKTNKDGDVIFSFTMPEALTSWKMMGLAYTEDLKVGHITKKLVTQKDLMIIPNQPRFFREGDEIWFSAKVVNMSEEELDGTAMLQLFDAISMQPVDELFSNHDNELEFSTSKGNSTSVLWKLKIPENAGPVLYRVMARSGSFSDGEEMMIPVLKNRMLVTESMPLPINGNETREYIFEKFAQNESNTLVNHAYTLEFTSNPAWYAVQALPYLMEYPHECSEQTFNRLYANALASHIVDQQPGIKNVFESWKTTTPDALLSKLEKNQDLKNALLEETPWVMQAGDESERKKRLALLFDLNKMDNELNASLNKLRKSQLSNGGWPWFKGGRDNRFITQYILTGFGKMKHLGVLKSDNATFKNIIRDAIRYTDDRMFEDFTRIKDRHDDYLKRKYISRYHIQYLYARSFFMDEYFLLEKHKEAFLYFKEQAKTFWLDHDRYVQGMIALSMNRLEEKPVAQMIVASLKEHALYDHEMGMYWRGNAGYYWYEAPIETQALMIEAFDEILNDKASVELMKAWLLKQKQTQDWRSTKATADACYALLLRGANLIAEEGDVRITVGNKEFDPSEEDGVEQEAGTGYFRHQWSGSDINTDMATIKISKSDDGIAWGAVYWQYFEDLDKITPHASPLSIQKKLFVEIITDEGPVLKAVNDGDVLRTGDKLISRIEIRVDRDMEFVHMKDMRAAALEPRNALSGYKWQGGMGYYESIRDASVNFFFSHLRKGTWIFEYPVNVTQRGVFSNGITSIQCMYAPEFASHSEGVMITVE